MYKDDKKYHMDLKENARGRFLKVSETFTRGYSRFQVIFLYYSNASDIKLKFVLVIYSVQCPHTVMDRETDR